jgi:hypothetical protein
MFRLNMEDLERQGSLPCKETLSSDLGGIYSKFSPFYYA